MANMKVLKYLFLLLFFISCATNEYKLIGITSRLQEIFYYGKDFTVTAWNVDEEQLTRIKLELKNSLAVQKLDNPKEKWKEVTDISLKDGSYILFQIFPESRVPAEFLSFKFLLNDTSPTKSYSYYSEILETNIRGRYYYPGPFYAGGFYGGYGGFAYPMNGRQTEQITQRIVHSYNFLVLFPSQEMKTNRLKVTTPAGNKIEFELSNP